MLADSLLIVDNPVDVDEITRLVEEAGQSIRVKEVEQPTLSQVYRGKLGSFLAYLEDVTTPSDADSDLNGEDSPFEDQQELSDLLLHLNEIKGAIEYIFAQYEPGNELPDPEDEVFELSSSSKELWNATIESWLEESDGNESGDEEEFREAVADLLSVFQKSFQKGAYSVLLNNGLIEIREDAIILTGTKDSYDLLFDHPKEICELSGTYADFQIEYLQRWTVEEEYHLVIPNQVAFWLKPSDIADVIGSSQGDFCSIERCEQTLLFLSMLGNGTYEYLSEHGTSSVEEITEALQQICFETDSEEPYHFSLDPTQVREILKLMKKAGFVKGKGNSYTAVRPSKKR